MITYYSYPNKNYIFNFFLLSIIIIIITCTHIGVLAMYGLMGCVYCWLRCHLYLRSSWHLQQNWKILYYFFPLYNHKWQNFSILCTVKYAVDVFRLVNTVISSEYFIRLKEIADFWYILVLFRSSTLYSIKL